MTECKYLYDFDYSCGHHAWERLDRQLTRDEYYLRAAGKCPACRAVTAEDDAVLSARKSALLSPPDKRAHWDERKRTCPVCGVAKILVDTAKGVMCRACRREKGMMDGKQGICDVCGRRLVLHYTGIAGRLMVCRHCWEKVTGKPAPAAWAQPGPKGGRFAK